MPWRFLIPLLFLLPSLSLQAATHGAHAAPLPSPARELDSTSPDDVFAQMRQSFRADRARGQHIRYQFNFGDPQGGKWWVEINDGACTMGKGIVQHPDVTLACTGADWVRLSNGTLSGFQAFLTGRLRIKGNQFTARKLDDIFP